MRTKLLKNFVVCAALFQRKIQKKGPWYFLLAALYYCKIRQLEVAEIAKNGMRSVLVHLRTTTPKALDNYIKDTIFFSSINFYVKQHDHLLDRAFGYMNHTLESSQYLNGIEAKIRFERGGKTFFNRVNFYVKQHNYRLACTTDPNIPNSNSTCLGDEFDTT